MQVLIDPNEFQIVQNKMFASFNNVNSDIVFLAIYTNAGSNRVFYAIYEVFRCYVAWA